MEEWDWDLQAVVRGCSRGGGGVAAEARDSLSSFPSSSVVLREEDDGLGFVREEQSGALFFCFPDLLGTTAVAEKAENYSSVQELEQLFKPFFFPKSSPSPSQPLLQYPQQIPSSTSSAVSPRQTRGVVAVRKQKNQIPVSIIARSKRRKNQQKKVVCHVPVDGLSSDMWAWRKYGQKPIKGSPFPRGYYRCSSSKGCLARKQVERSRTDPGVFVITYTAEHNHPIPTHRNSLAGSTRHKFPQSSPSSSTITTNQVNSSGTGENLILSSTSSMFPTTPLTSSIDEELFLSVKKKGTEEELEEEQDDDDDDEGMLLVSDMEMLGEDDMLFFGLDDLHQPTSGEHFPTTATTQFVL